MSLAIPGVAMLVAALTAPFDYQYGCDGPNQFPRRTPIWTPVRYHRYLVWRDAAGREPYNEAAGLDALNLSDRERAVVEWQCQLIRENTQPAPRWDVPADPMRGLPLSVAWADELDPRSRALPKPSKAPPMWADNPTRQRRAKKTRNHRRVK